MSTWKSSRKLWDLSKILSDINNTDWPFNDLFTSTGSAVNISLPQFCDLAGGDVPSPPTLTWLRQKKHWGNLSRFIHSQSIVTMGLSKSRGLQNWTLRECLGKWMTKGKKRLCIRLCKIRPKISNVRSLSFPAYATIYGKIYEIV